MRRHPRMSSLRAAGSGTVSLGVPNRTPRGSPACRIAGGAAVSLPAEPEPAPTALLSDIYRKLGVSSREQAVSRGRDGDLG